MRLAQAYPPDTNNYSQHSQEESHGYNYHVAGPLTPQQFYEQQELGTPHS